MEKNTHRNTPNDNIDLSKKTEHILNELQKYKNDKPKLIYLWEKTILKYRDNLFMVLLECERMLEILPTLNNNIDLNDIHNALTIYKMTST
tara:strand:- start:199 stop:471 length:273 start_codon:yes stop_codon:yes gene_type:complete